MNAVVSGQAKVALLIEGETLSSLKAGRPVKVIPRSAGEVPLLFGDAKDLQFLEAVELEEVSSRLERASKEVDALHLALILLDESLEPDTRRTAAEELEEMLEAEGIQRFVGNVLHAHPLPRGADLAGAVSACPGDAELVRYLLERLGALQDSITEAHLAWERIPEYLFEGKRDRVYARSIVVREGFFHDLVVILASKGPLGAFFTTSLFNNKFCRMHNYYEILQAWVSTLLVEQIDKLVDQMDPAVTERLNRSRYFSWVKPQTKVIAAAPGQTYELMYVIDPRVPDEDVVTMTQEYKSMITAGGSRITGEENWGRRKLAYPINKLNEGKYVLLYISSDAGETALPEVEHRMRQNDKILRYLTVRTDEDLKRSARRQPAEEEGPAAESGSVEGKG